MEVEVVLVEKNGAGERITLEKCPKCRADMLHRATAKHYISEDCYTPRCFYWTFKTIGGQEDEN